MSDDPSSTNQATANQATSNHATSDATPAQAPAPVSVFSAPAMTTIVLPTNYRMRPPTPYEGQRDGFLCEAWLASLRRFLIAANIPVDQRTLHSVMYLAGTAALWWEGLRRADSTHIDVFVALFRDAFCPRNFLESVRSELLRITMTSTIGEYVTRFRRYMAVLTPDGSNAMDSLNSLGRSAFIAGLPDNLKRNLYAQLDLNTVSIDTVINAAEYFDSLKPVRTSAHAPAPAPSSIWPTTSASSSPTTPMTAAPTRDPMAMELDNLRLELNAVRRQLQNHNQSRSSGQLPRLTNEDRERLRASGGCFRCRGPGHQARQCRANPVSVHNTNVGVFPTGSSYSGNASSGQV